MDDIHEKPPFLGGICENAPGSKNAHQLGVNHLLFCAEWVIYSVYNSLFLIHGPLLYPPKPKTDHHSIPYVANPHWGRHFCWGGGPPYLDKQKAMSPHNERNSDDSLDGVSLPVR